MKNRRGEIVYPFIDVIKETESIIKRLENREISPDFAKKEILYMIRAAKTMAELNAARAAYDYVRITNMPLDV